MAHNARRIWVSGAALLCVLGIAASCRRQTEEPVAKTVELPKPVPDQVSTQVVSIPPQLQSATDVVESVTVSTNSQIMSLKTEIIETAGRRGAVAGKLSELYKNAMVVDDQEIAAMDADIAARRAALVAKIIALPEVFEKHKALDELEKKKKDLLASRNAIIAARKNQASESVASSNAVEQVQAIDDNLLALQKEFQTLLAEHRSIVQKARENNPEIRGLAAEITDKEAARSSRLNSLPGVKVMLVEQVELEARLRDLKTKLRLLVNSQSTTNAPQPKPSVDTVVP